MTTITTTIFKSIKNAFPSKVCDESIEQFLERWKTVEHQPLADKNKAEAFTLCRYDEGKGRQKSNIQSVSGVVLDIDRAMTAEAISAIGERLPDDKAFIVHSTYSSTAERHKMRILLPLATPVTAETFVAEKLALRAAKLLGTPPIDPACQSPAQLYFVPSCKPGAEAEHFLDVSDGTVPWAMEDFPGLEAGDEARYLDQKAKSATAISDQVNKRSTQEIYGKLEKLKAIRFGGVEPIYTQHTFYEYKDGYWKAISTPALKRDLMRCVFNESEAPEAVSSVVEVMAMRSYLDEFPSCETDESGNGNGSSPLICLTNGTLDPIRKVMVSNSEKHYLRSQMPYDYDPDAACDEWKRFLNHIFEPDADRKQKIDLLQEFMGYLLIPSAKYQVMLWLLGPGSNGKSVINEVIIKMLGEANVSAISLDKISKRFQSAELVGKLANISDELEADGYLRDDMLKQAVAGNRIQGEYKNKNPFYFRPYARFVVAMNKLPRIKDTSHGFFRRLMLLTFNRIIAKEEQDRELVQKLTAELPGIFVWALEGLKRLNEHGVFTEVPSSIAALAEFKEECNPVALFVRDLVIPTDKVVDISSKRGIAKVLIHDVYRTYSAYCRAKGFMPLSDARFGREMSSMGYTARKSSGKRFYALQLRKPEDVGILGMEAPQVSQVSQTSLDDELGDGSIAA